MSGDAACIRKTTDGVLLCHSDHPSFDHYSSSVDPSPVISHSTSRTDGFDDIRKLDRAVMGTNV